MPTSFVITGFGPFGGVKENPTTVIVRKLDAYLRKNDKCHTNEGGSTVADLVKEYVILETSAQAVNETMARIQNEHSSSISNTHETHTGSCNKQNVIFLHLGVGRSRGFRLESCAYNEATFRIPDQRGYQPKEQAIVKSDPVGLSYQTSLDLESLQKQMLTDFPTISTVISIDPGRFVCNYVYCKSLEVTSSLNSQQEKSMPEKSNMCWESLFLHVPHFDIISEEDQLAYVAGLIQNLAAGQGAWFREFENETGSCAMPVSSSVSEHPLFLWNLYRDRPKWVAWLGGARRTPLMRMTTNWKQRYRHESVMRRVVSHWPIVARFVVRML